MARCTLQEPRYLPTTVVALDSHRSFFLPVVLTCLEFRLVNSNHPNLDGKMKATNQFNRLVKQQKILETTY